jgi:hypothetical protein
VFQADYMIYFAAEMTFVIVQQAVFADKIGSLGDLLAQLVADVVSHDCRS